MLKSAEIEVVKMKERARKEVKEEMQKLAIQLAEKIIRNCKRSCSANLNG